MSSYGDLRVWQRSFSLTVTVYKLCEQLPLSEQDGIIAQIRRCAVSIPSNIAEGQQRYRSRTRVDSEDALHFTGKTVNLGPSTVNY